MTKLLPLLILSLATAFTGGHRIEVPHDGNGAPSSIQILSLDEDIDFFGDSLYSFQLLRLNDADDNARYDTRKWIVHKVSERRLEANIIQTNDKEKEEEDHSAEEDELYHKLFNAAISLLCVTTAALAAGLTMGLLSLDPVTLEIKRRASTSAEERKYSEDLLPLLVGHSKRHRLLVTLLLMNAAANEALPLFLDELFPGKLASILVSVTLVLFFGEIVPSGKVNFALFNCLLPFYHVLIGIPFFSALFTGPDQVKIAARLVPMVKVMMFILSPLAVPIAKVLDKVLNEDDGHDGNHHNNHLGNEEEEGDVTGGNYYNRGELSALVRIQYEAQVAAEHRKQNTPLQGLAHQSSSGSSNHIHTHNQIRTIGKELSTLKDQRTRNRQKIHEDEITMIEGALAMTTKIAADVCTPMRRVYALPSDTLMDEDTMVKIWSRGFSRIPVYSSVHEDASRIIGVLLTRQLIVVNPEEERPITTLPLPPPPCIEPSVHLVDLINTFQAGGGRGKSGLHLAIVCARPLLASTAMENGEPIPKEAGVVGIVTLEDVVEELLQEEIYDETDRDLELARRGIDKWKRFVKRKKNVKDTGAVFDSAFVKKVVSVAEMKTKTEKTPLLLV